MQMLRKLQSTSIPILGTGRRLLQTNSTTAPTNKRMVIEKLADRELVRVQGVQVASFLQGLITNDMQHLEERPVAVGFASMYAMFLNKAGRVQYDSIVYRTPEPEQFLLECDRSVSEELRRHLRLYRVRRRIDIESVDDELRLWAVFDPDASVQQTIGTEVTLHDGSDTKSVKYVAVSDPRLRQLGWRILTAPDASWDELAAGVQKVCNCSVIAPTAEYNYRVHRYRFGIGEGVLDLPPGKCFPLECNCDFLHGVSFHKGCYIGQELTARVHHTGVVRKRLMPLTLNAPVPASSDESVKTENGNKVGTLRGIAHNRALALMRIDAALKAEKLLVTEQPCAIEKPEWWAVESPTRATIAEGR